MDPCGLMFIALIVTWALGLVLIWQNTTVGIRTEERQFYVLIAGLVGLGVVFAMITPIASALQFIAHTTFGWVAEVEERLGDALIIAGILAFAVDRFMKGQLLAEVTRDVLSFAAGHALPDGLKERVNGLIRLPYARNSFTMCLVLTPLAREGFVRVTMHTTYVVSNLTGEPRRYLVKSAIEKSPWHDEIEPGRLISVKISGPTTQEFDAAQLPGLQPGQTQLAFSTGVDLPKKGGAPLVVETVRSAVYRDSWYYILDFVDTTEVVTIITKPVPGIRRNVNVPQLEVQPVPQGDAWPCGGVYLPGQFVRISWTRT